MVSRFIPAPLKLTRRLVEGIVAITNYTVASGPFTGMRYVKGASAGAYPPKLLGIYERELHQSVNAIAAWNPSCVVHIGAAEGYYVVGMARLTNARQIAFEIAEEGRSLCRNLSQLNGVDHLVQIEGRCNLADLAQMHFNSERVALICDVEGAEDVLLDPGVAVWMSRAMVLVELHEFEAPGVSDRLLKRFAASHHITKVLPESRDWHECPTRAGIDQFIPRRYRAKVVSEGRQHETPWLFMSPIDCTGK
ncbi:hypothetical protein [Verrucomicrobium spinosum]|uniref:hypothetical protein n=1 Tax=Verrucomicrobium spinosum TaxID=2736 RepID=UPI00017462F2|nr:hypothetical protein [Verrucomicrobium spinosum]